MTVNELLNQLQEAIKGILKARSVSIAPMQGHIKIKITYKVGAMKYSPKAINKIRGSAINSLESLTKLSFDARLEAAPHANYELYLAELSSENISKDRARKVAKSLKYFSICNGTAVRTWCESIVITAKPRDREAFKKFVAAT